MVDVSPKSLLGGGAVRLLSRTNLFTITDSIISGGDDGIMAKIVPGGKRRVTHLRQCQVRVDGDVEDDGGDEALITIILTEAGRGATVNGESVAIDTLLGADPNTDNYWAETGYDPEADLTADGLVYADVPPAFIGALRSAMFSAGGGTFVIGLKQVESNVQPVDIVAVPSSGGAAIEFSFANRNLSVGGGGQLSLLISNIVNAIEGTPGSVNVVAFTLVPGERLDVAINGADAVTSELDEDDWPDENEPVAFLIDTQDAIQFIKQYAPLPDTTGLSELSETGVANTAPHGLDWDWNFGTNASTNEIMNTTGPIGVGSGVMNVNQFDPIIDDEGNPITLSIVDDDTEQLEIAAPPLVSTRVDGDGISEGVYNFTVRASDPGGLFTEQEFTLTVLPSIMFDDDNVVTEVSESGAAYAKIYVSGCDLVEAVSVPNATFAVEEVEIAQNAVIESIDLSSLETVGTHFKIFSNATLNSLDIGNLTTVPELLISDSALVLLDLSSLETVTTGFNINTNASLTTITFGTFVEIATHVDLSANALNEVSVNAILAKLVALDGTGGTTLFENKFVHLNLGTNAPPGAAGLTSIATLEGRGCTVNVNS